MNGSPVLIGVGVGPGDPELVTVKAIRVLREADVVLVPVSSPSEQGRAEATVRAHVPDRPLRRVVFALDDRNGVTPRRETAWEAAASAVADAISAGAHRIGFATIGDPNVYSTFSYLAQGARRLVPGLVVETVPGITAMQDLAMRSGVPLCEGTESLALFPMTAGLDAYRDVLRAVDTVVAYKGGRHLPEVLAALDADGRLEGAVVGSGLGLPDERIEAATTIRRDGRRAPYLTTVISPPRRAGRGARL